MIRDKTKLRLWVAAKLNVIFKRHYCWADLVGWAFSEESYFDLIRRFDLKKGSSGCKSESETHDSDMCYCGQWNKGVYFKNKSKFNTNETIENLETEILPF